MSLTAKAFHDPLLLTLAELANWQAGVYVPHGTVYLPAAAKLGITDLDHLGADTSSGQSRIIKLIQWAHKEARRKGQAVALGRGDWALTSLGLQRAQTLKAPVLTEAVPVVAPLPSVFPDDPYLVGLLQEQTPCFGYFSTKSPICKDCPIQAPCRKHVLVVHLDAATVLARSTVPVGPANIQLVPMKVNDPKTLCPKCGFAFTIKERGFWPWDTTDRAQKPVLYHGTCLPPEMLPLLNALSPGDL